MSLRTMERILLSTSLIFGLSAMGCGDGDDVSSDAGTKPMDSGVKDAGPKDSGPKADTGGDEEELPSMACGSNTCTGILLSEVVVDPCCVVDGAGKATDQCGLDSVDIKRVNSTSPFSGCVPKDVPKASDSAYCGEFWDQVEMGGKVNGGLDIKSGTVTLTFDGCCLPTGECGALIDTPRGQNADDLNTHLGCVSFTRLSTALNGADAGAVAQPEHLPYCNSSTGSPLKGDETVTGKPKFVCGCGDGKVDEGKGTFPCFNNLPTTVCGADQPKAEELAMIPEFICGCTQASKLPCMVNVAAATCGTKQIDANSVELALVPVFICGESATPSALPTLKGVDPAVCGKKAVAADSDDLAAVPEFICGEMGNPDTSGLPTLKNLAATICGRLDITTGNPYLATVPEFLCGCPATPTFPCLRNVGTDICGAKEITGTSNELMAVPEFVCGCGADVVDPHTGLPCLSHVEDTVCGGTLIAADSAALDSVPEFICGKEGLTTTPSLPVMRNVESTICGKKVITSTSVELAGIPVFICGGENNPPTNALPTMPNVDTTVCGTQLVPAGAATLSKVPAVVCGCGNVGPTNEFGCMRNVDVNVCGLDRSLFPVITCGCGATTGLGPTQALCLPYTPATTCGTAAVALDATNNCLTSLPEYVVGCGSSPSSTCVPGLPALHGCTAVSAGSSSLRGVAPFLCGCGDGVAFSGARPCLDNIPTSVCGRTPTALDTFTSIDMSVCGCGTSVTYDPSNPVFAFPCLSKTDTATCGSPPIATSDPNNTPGTTADDCYTKWPAYLHGCGPGVTTGSCIKNGSTTTFGCAQPAAGRSVPSQPYYACGCGVGVVPSTTPCIPNVATDVCGNTAPTPTDLAARATFFCGCGDDVASRPSGAPSGRPCLSYTSMSTCGAGSPTVNAGTLQSLPSNLCGCNPPDESAVVTYNPLTFPGPCLSKTARLTCGGV